MRSSYLPLADMEAVMTKQKPKRERLVAVNFRMPTKMRMELEAEAKKHNNTLSREIINLLRQSFLEQDLEAAEQVKEMVAEIRRRLNQ